MSVPEKSSFELSQIEGGLWSHHTARTTSRLRPFRLIVIVFWAAGGHTFSRRLYDHAHVQRFSEILCQPNDLPPHLVLFR